MTGIEARFALQRPGFTLKVELNLPPRGVIALFGPSGCGKTSLLRCMAGLERAPQGRLVVNGEVWQDEKIWLPTHQRALGYVFQEASLFAHLTVLGNLRYGMRRAAGSQAADLQAAIDLLGIGALLQRRIEHLSGGERQRVSIACALALRPRLLLLDEPLAALDMQRKQEILPYLEQLQRKLDIPLLYVSHAIDEVLRLADYIVALKDGQVVAAGPLSQTLAQLDVPLHLGEDLGVVWSGVVAQRDDHWQLARLQVDGASLWLPDTGQPLGQLVRLRILARDVSVALQAPRHSSTLNSLPAQLLELAADEHPASMLLRLSVGTTPLLARITRRSVAELGLMAGQTVWLQIKAVALIA